MEFIFYILSAFFLVKTITLLMSWDSTAKQVYTNGLLFVITYGLFFTLSLDFWSRPAAGFWFKCQAFYLLQFVTK